MSTDSAVALLVGLVLALLLLSIRNYLSNMSVIVKQLQDDLNRWKEETLRECIRRPEWNRHVDELERYKREYISHNFHEIRNLMNRRPLREK